jgi:GH15 family glucan-1,4-alpha-glucosidase
MAVASVAETRALVLPEHEMVRVVECTDGEVEVDIEYAPRPRYAQRAARLRDEGVRGIHAEGWPGVLVLRTDAALAIGEDEVARGRLRLREGERVQFSLSYTTEAPAVIPALGDRTEDVLARCAAWWRAWASQATYTGPYRDAVIRSALALKLLTYTPSSAIVAAATTSLPESLGGASNWDYRYCWLRDAAFTSRAFFGLGFDAEARAFVEWLVHATRLTREKLRVLYDVYGIAPKAERELAHLAGWGGSRPVRVGNAAAAQVQLDVYGEVIDAVGRMVDAGAPADRDTRRMLLGLGDFVCRHWREPDSGLWEPRGPPRIHVHTLAMCWVAMNRLLGLHDRFRWPRSRVPRYHEAREALRSMIEARGFNARLGSYTTYLDDDSVDASLLLLGWYDFEPPSSPRMRGTYARVRERLGAGPLLYRYGPEQGAGTFGICAFWAVEHLARGGGTLDEARALFEEIVATTNDLGLMSEEIDASTRAARGNFPQAFSHIGLINAALSIEERAKREEHRR